MTWVQNLPCENCGSKNISLPCGNADGAVVACTDAASVGQVALTKSSCTVHASNTATYGKETICCVIAATVTIKTGCPACKLWLVNENSSKRVLVSGVLHWAWAGSQFFFWPDTSVNDVSDVNSVFAEDDVITVIRADFGKPAHDNTALAFVYGVDQEYSTASKNGIKFGAKTRFRFGSANVQPRCDYTVLEFNPRLNVEPGDTYIRRQYYITDNYQGLDRRAGEFVSEVYQAQFEQGSYSANNRTHAHTRSVSLYAGADASKLGVTLNNSQCGNSSAALRCTGFTTPRTDTRPLFYIQCALQTYVGEDPYHFAPPRANTSMPIQAYVCRGENATLRPSVMLLGWFAPGACAFVANAVYSEHYCATPNVSQTPALSLGVFKIRMALSVPLQLKDFTEQKQADFRAGIAAAAQVDVAQVVIISITSLDGTTLTPASSVRRRLLGGGDLRVAVEVVGLSDSSSAALMSSRLTTQAINEGLASLGFAAVSIAEAPSVVDGGAPARAEEHQIDGQLSTHSASGVGGLWRDPYGKTIAADAPVGWWRLNTLRDHPRVGSLKESPCISCKGSRVGGPASHRGGTRDGGALECLVEQPHCTASLHRSLVSITGIPNSEALERRAGSAYVPKPSLGPSFSPAEGEGIAAVSGGASGGGGGVRLPGLGGLEIPFSDDVLGFLSFTFEMWMRIRSYYVAVYVASVGGAVCNSSSCTCSEAGVPAGAVQCGCTCERKLGVTRGGREQAVASCGWVVLCDNMADRFCSHSTQAGTNHGWELIIKRDGKMAVRLATKNGRTPHHHPRSTRGGGVGGVGRGGLEGGDVEGLGAGAFEMVTKTEILSDLSDKWTLVSLVVDSDESSHVPQSRVSLYYNATLSVSEAFPRGEYVPSSSTAAPHMLIGQPHRRKGTAYYLRADLDEIAFFPKALTQLEIIQHYLATTYDTNHVRPHIDCVRTTTDSPTSTARQTHTNPVQSCPIADQGLKRLLGFGNVPTETVIDAIVGRRSRTGADFADAHQRHQSDVGIASPVDVALDVAIS